MEDESKAEAIALAFWRDLALLEEKHGVELSHEDSHGSFRIITEYGTVGTAYSNAFRAIKEG
jgi:hypothetical protein